MAKRIPKSEINVDIWVTGRNETSKGLFRLTSGNVYYQRANAKDWTAEYTYQQLIKLIEKDLNKSGRN